MADISKEIKAFQDAVYGEEVRGSMISLAEKMNAEVETGTEKVTEYGKSESARAQAEKDRVAAENLRKSAETKRAQDFAAMQQESEDATEAANTAASNANSKASLANTAAGAANTAAGSANTAASGANAAKQTALQAAAEAEEATEAANTAATNANSKAALANTAAGNANTAADRANEAAEAAEGLVIGDISEKTVTFEMALQRANIQSNDSLAVAFGKLAKFCADLDDHAFSAPVNNLLGTDPALALAAPMGKTLDDKITALNSALAPLAINPAYTDSVYLGIVVSIHEVVYKVYRNLLESGKPINASVRIGIGAEQDAVHIMGAKYDSNRGRYIAGLRTSDDMYIYRITDAGMRYQKLSVESSGSYAES